MRTSLNSLSFFALLSSPFLPITPLLGFQELEPQNCLRLSLPGHWAPSSCPSQLLRTQALPLQVSNWKGTPTALSLPWHFLRKILIAFLEIVLLFKKKKKTLGNLVSRILSCSWLVCGSGWTLKAWEGLADCACGDLLFTRGLHNFHYLLILVPQGGCSFRPSQLPVNVGVTVSAELFLPDLNTTALQLTRSEKFKRPVRLQEFVSSPMPEGAASHEKTQRGTKQTAFQWQRAPNEVPLRTSL